MKICIKTNIEWNRTMYKNYNKLHKHLYSYESYIEPTIYTMGKEMWDYFYHLINYCHVDKHHFIKKNNQLIFNWSKLNNLDDINHLFALLSTNLNDENAKLWITKIVQSIKKTIILEKKNIENIWYIGFNMNSEDIVLKGASLGGYGPSAEKIDNIDPKQIMNDSWKLKDANSIEKALYYNIKSNEETWAMFNIGQHINNNPLLNHIYRRQFEVIGLMDYFMKESTNTLGFNNKIDTKIAVLESGGLIDYDDHVTYPKMDVNKQSGSKKMHANLVGRICCSSVGVDQHSTIYSTTFDNTTYWTIHKSLEWLIEKGVKIINCSFGLHKFTPNDPDYIEYSNISYKFDYIVRKYGITILKASGNHNTNTGGTYPFFRGNDLAINIINVGSTKSDGTSVSLFSNFRKYPNHQLTKESPKPLLVAPGEDYLYTTGTSHNGTSFSTPLVTGMVSILMKEFSQLIDNPVCVKAILAASSNDIYTGQYNTNGLKNRTGSGLADYAYARKACKNLKYKDIDNTTPNSTIVLESECFTLNVNDRLYVATATLFNGGYTKFVTTPSLLPTRYYLSSAPIIGYIYLSIAYHHNQRAMNDFKKFYEEEFERLKFNKVYDIKNPDNSLLPPDLKVYLKKFDLRTGKWHDVSWTNGSTATFSNIEKYFYKNVGETGSFKYQVVLNKQAKHLPFDNTKNKIAATHVIRL